MRAINFSPLRAHVSKINCGWIQGFISEAHELSTCAFVIDLFKGNLVRDMIR